MEKCWPSTKRKVLQDAEQLQQEEFSFALKELFCFYLMVFTSHNSIIVM